MVKRGGIDKLRAQIHVGQCNVKGSALKCFSGACNFSRGDAGDVDGGCFCAKVHATVCADGYEVDTFPKGERVF